MIKFNTFCKLCTVNAEREQFFDFVKAATQTPVDQCLPEMTWNTWCDLLDAFYAQVDTADLRDTQADCLGTL